MGFEGFPFVIGWELTVACNLRCRHCGSSAGTPKAHELTLQESLAICDQFPALLVQEVDFTGGEPLMRPGWEVIATHLSELGIVTKILTNGILLHDETIARIIHAGITGIGVSLDGLNSTHDYVRGQPGMFRRVVEAIERATHAGLPVTIITTAHALNVHELPRIKVLLESLGVKRWQVQPVFPLGRVRDGNELQLTAQSYLELGLFVRDFGPLAGENGLELLPADSFGYFTEFDTRTPPWRGCPAGLLACGITSDGKVKGCLSLPNELVEGDLRQRDLWDIWFDPNSFPYTRNFCLDQLGVGCRSCELADQCRGGCSAMSYGATGQFHSDPYCFHALLNGYPSCLAVQG